MCALINSFVRLDCFIFFYFSLLNSKTKLYTTKLCSASFKNESESCVGTYFYRVWGVSKRTCYEHWPVNC